VVLVMVSGGGCSSRTPLSCGTSLRGKSYAAAERAVSAAGHVIVDMADFPAADQPPAELCMERMRRCDVYLGVLGTRYGSPVRDRPEVSYTELEFDTATPRRALTGWCSCWTPARLSWVSRHRL
jgi:hypothetical protein